MISDETGRVGLMKMLLQLNTVVNSLVSRYENSDKSPMTLEELFGEHWYFYYGYGDTANNLLLNSYTYSTDNYGKLVGDLEEKSTTLAWVAGVVCVVLGLFTWRFVIRRLSRGDHENRKMLSLVPDKFLFNNFMMKKYLGLELFTK